MRKANYYVSGEYEPLPHTDVIVPDNKLDIEARLRTYTDSWKLNRLTDSWDKGNKAKLAMAAINKMLDHYPNGSPRDYIAQYAEIVPVTEVVEDEIAA
jgi:hypothetical protein